MEALEQENRRLQDEISLEHNMVGDSPRMRDVYQFIARVAPRDTTVLIFGESGTGKNWSPAPPSNSGPQQQALRHHQLRRASGTCWRASCLVT